jgi:hypothetical protein
VIPLLDRDGQVYETHKLDRNDYSKVPISRTPPRAVPASRKLASKKDCLPPR